MIFGRATNLWLGFVTAFVGFVSVSAVVAGADPTAVATIGGGATGLLGALVALIAGGTPTVKAGSDVNVVTATPAGEKDLTTTVTV